jgi:ribosomal protein S3AE
MLCIRYFTHNAIFKTHAEDLTDEERHLISNYCTKVDMYSLKMLLTTNFKGVYYSNEMLHNLVRREKDLKNRHRSL